MSDERDVVREFEIALRPGFYSNVRLGKVMRKLGPQVLAVVRSLRKANEAFAKENDR